MTLELSKCCHCGFVGVLETSPTLSSTDWTNADLRKKEVSIIKLEERLVCMSCDARPATEQTDMALITLHDAGVRNEEATMTVVADGSDEETQKGKPVELMMPSPLPSEHPDIELKTDEESQTRDAQLLEEVVVCGKHLDVVDTDANTVDTSCWGCDFMDTSCWGCDFMLGMAFGRAKRWLNTAKSTAWFMCLSMWYTGVMNVSDVLSDLNIARQLSSEAPIIEYEHNERGVLEPTGRRVFRHTAWVGIIMFSVFCPFILSWASKLMLDRVAQPIEEAVQEAKRPDMYQEAMAWLHVFPYTGILKVILIEASDIAWAIFVAPYKLFTCTFFPDSEEEKAKFLQRLEKHRMEELCRDFFFRLFFENIIQFVLQFHIWNQRAQLKINDLVSPTALGFSIITTTLSIVNIIYKVYSLYHNKWSSAYGSSWILCLLGNKLSTLQDFGYYTPDWVPSFINRLDSKFIGLTIPPALRRGSKDQKERRDQGLAFSERIFGHVLDHFENRGFMAFRGKQLRSRLPGDDSFDCTALADALSAHAKVFTGVELSRKISMWSNISDSTIATLQPHFSEYATINFELTVGFMELLGDEELNYALHKLKSKDYVNETNLSRPNADTTIMGNEMVKRLTLEPDGGNWFKMVPMDFVRRMKHPLAASMLAKLNDDHFRPDIEKELNKQLKSLGDTNSELNMQYMIQSAAAAQLVANILSEQTDELLAKIKKVEFGQYLYTEGCNALASAITRMPNVGLVDFSVCEIGDDVAVEGSPLLKLISDASVCPEMALDMRGNQLSQEAKDKLKATWAKAGRTSNKLGLG